MKPSLPCPRSVLFVPADKPEVAIKAIRSQADAVCLDLEDAVSPARKPLARDQLTDLVQQAAAQAKPVWVRINADMLNAAWDITALPAGVAAIVVPKAQGWSRLQWIQQALQARFGADQAAIPGLVAMFEQVQAIQHCLQTAPPSELRLQALALGTEDLSSDLGVTPNRPLLTMVLYDLLKLGQNVACPVLGFPDSIALIADTARLQDSIALARQLGSSGAFCIHPRQLDSVNQGFMPTAAEIEWAQATLTLEAQIVTTGVAKHPLTQQMVDAPVVEQARTILARAGERGLQG